MTYLPLISRTKSLSKGLILACPMDDLECQDIVFDRVPTKFGGTFTLTDGPKGRRALTSPDKASGFTFDAISGDRLTAGAGWSYSMSIWYNRSGTSTNYAVPGPCYQHSSWASPAAMLAGADSTNGYQMYAAQSANTTTAQSQFAGQTHIQDRWMHIAMSVRCGIALNWTGYDSVTGQTFQTKAAAFDRLPSASGASSPTWTLFNQPGGTLYGFPGGCCLAAAWNRALTPDELQVVRHWDLQ